MDRTVEDHNDVASEPPTGFNGHQRARICIKICCLTEVKRKMTSDLCTHLGSDGMSPFCKLWLIFELGWRVIEGAFTG